MRLYAASYLLPVEGLPIAGGAIAVEDGEIVAVGTLDLLKAVCPGEVTEFPGCVIMPGLVNAHSHLELTHFPAWKMRHGMDYAPRSFVDWLIQVVKIKRGVTDEDLRHSVREGIRISLESGTTTLGEILSNRDLISLYGESPLAGRLYFEAIGHDPVRCAALLADLGRAAALDTGGFLPGLSPHTPYTVYAADGKKAKSCQNHAGPDDQVPFIVPLEPGSYDVYAEAAGLGRVKVPVLIQRGRITTVFLERGGMPSKTEALMLGAPVVRAPDGRIIGAAPRTD